MVIWSLGVNPHGGDQMNSWAEPAPGGGPVGSPLCSGSDVRCGGGAHRGCGRPDPWNCFLSKNHSSELEPELEGEQDRKLGTNNAVAIVHVKGAEQEAFGVPLLDQRTAQLLTWDTAAPSTRWRSRASTSRRRRSSSRTRAAEASSSPKPS